MTKQRTRQPMLAGEAPEDLSKIKYPVLASPKLDGYRILTVLEDGKTAVKTRKFLELPNHYVRKILETLPPGLDGELIHPSLDFAKSGAYRRIEGEPEFIYYVFDFACTDEEYELNEFDHGHIRHPFGFRFNRSKRYFENEHPFVKVVPHLLVKNAEELQKICEQHIAEGYEGTMIRDPEGEYKFGRSTVKEGGLLKIKQWSDAEAEVIGFVERMHNANEAEKNVFGRTKRSTKKDNKVGLDTLGSFICRDLKTGVVFNVPGKTQEFNQEIWDNKPKYLGKIMTYEFQRAGMDEAPRFPGFKRWFEEM